MKQTANLEGISSEDLSFPPTLQDAGPQAEIVLERQSLGSSPDPFIQPPPGIRGASHLALEAPGDMTQKGELVLTAPLGYPGAQAGGLHCPPAVGAPTEATLDGAENRVHATQTRRAMLGAASSTPLAVCGPARAESSVRAARRRAATSPTLFTSRGQATEDGRTAGRHGPA